MPILLRLLLCLWLAAPAVYAATAGEVAVGSVLREAYMQALNGPANKLSNFRGQPLLINVWASWCGPCRQEMASIERLHRRYGGQQFTVIGISTDDYLDRATLFLTQSGVTFSNFIDRALLLENMLGADHLPLTLLVDARGRVLARFYGARAWDSPETVALIAKTLKIKL